MESKKALRWDESRKAFMYRNKVLPGLLPTLSSTFYPKYTYERAKYGSASITASLAGTAKKKGALKPTKKKEKEKKGIDLGKMVDNQVRSVVRLLKRYHLDLYHLTNPLLKPYPPELVDDNLGKNEIAETARSLHKYTHNLLEVLRRKNLDAVGAQIPVMLEDMGVATAIDLLCRHRQTQRYTVVEVKCGFTNYYEKHTVHPMNAPFEAFKDTPHNQHQLQLAFTRLMFCDTFKIPADKVDGFVVRLDDAGVTVYPLENWVTHKMVEAQQAIFTDRNLALPFLVHKNTRVLYVPPPKPKPKAIPKKVSRTPAARLKAKTSKKSLEKEKKAIVQKRRIAL